MWSVIQRDLAEFVTVVKSGTEEAAANVVSAVRQADAPQGKQDRSSAGLRALQADKKTYSDPVANADQAHFQSFSTKFDLAEKTTTISELLSDEPVVARIHAELVPEHVSAETFWMRYFFRAERFMKPGQSLALGFVDEEDEEDLTWEDDGHAGEDVPVESQEGGAGGKHPTNPDGAARELDKVRQERDDLAQALSQAQAALEALRSAANEKSAGESEAEAAATTSSEDVPSGREAQDGASDEQIQKVRDALTADFEEKLRSVHAAHARELEALRQELQSSEERNSRLREQVETARSNQASQDLAVQAQDPLPPSPPPTSTRELSSYEPKTQPPAPAAASVSSLPRDGAAVHLGDLDEEGDADGEWGEEDWS
eukprot:CAMPEP_0118973856 /NCGR_PEP_ID=MMETSP1173-20130426/10945_1 /TAXON_ID=1034831 /ORGANISM="Rhizochromulina marina cf, Strain CCMP1243" /LENGTH=371 /DNA_ID=CAMNT_0006923551 /DNA_START=105 /DNA_END=1220 /DNA_ORIENTATION=-